MNNVEPPIVKPITRYPTRSKIGVLKLIYNDNDKWLPSYNIKNNKETFLRFSNKNRKKCFNKKFN